MAVCVLPPPMVYVTVLLALLMVIGVLNAEPTIGLPPQTDVFWASPVVVPVPPADDWFWAPLPLPE